MNFLAVLIVTLASSVALLTVLALLKDSHDSLERIIRAGVVARDQFRLYRAAGWAAIDWDALATAWRPVLVLGVMLLILGAAGAVILDTFNPAHRPSLWMALLLAGLTGRLAMSVPCSWVRYVFIGDRKPPADDKPYMGPERRRHAE